MGIKLGFKQTEVGVIPEDWRILSLYELVDRSRSIRYGIVQPGKYDPQGRFMIRGQDYSKGWVDAYELFKVGAVVEERYRKARVKSGDLIITIVGAGTGHVEVIPEWLDGANLTQTTARIAIDPGKAESIFCKYVLQSNFGKNQIASYIKGAAQPGLNCGDVEKFQLPFPPEKSEQRDIATVLSDLEELLSALDTLIVKKKNLKHATMQELFAGKRRLLGFTDEWKEKQLGDVLKIRHGKSQQGITATNGKYPILATGGEIGRTNSFLYSKPSVLIGRKGTIDSPQYVDSPFWTIDTLFFTEIFSEAHPKFVFYKFNTIDWQSYNEASGVPSLNASTIESIGFKCPGRLEQEAIATILTDMDNEIMALEQRRDKTDALKQGVMQNLLTGKLRLV